MGCRVDPPTDDCPKTTFVVAMLRPPTLLDADVVDALVVDVVAVRKSVMLPELLLVRQPPFCGRRSQSKIDKLDGEGQPKGNKNWLGDVHI